MKEISLSRRRSISSSSFSNLAPACICQVFHIGSPYAQRARLVTADDQRTNCPPARTNANQTISHIHDGPLLTG